MNSRTHFASQLSKFLRLNGDKVINGSSKLSLTTSALCQLNVLFDTLLFPLDGSNLVDQNETYPQVLLEDVKFLFDFVRKTSSLKIFHGMQTLRGGIDLSRFANLQILELHKVPMHLVVGLDVLCSQLTVLICHRSICFLKEIFGNIEVEQQKCWEKLKELNIAFNYLEGFDQSLVVLPQVEHFDASHNNLKQLDEMQVMKNLLFVNLSYNSLENIPMLCTSLKVLCIRNNILESLEGLNVLPMLEELDASYNCISEHTALKPLKQLHNLRVLNLVGNPLFFHDKHRSLTSWYFHPSVINHGILLDGKIMNSEEVLHTLREARSSSFYTRNANTHQTAINVIIEDADSNRWIPDHVSSAPKTESIHSENISSYSTEANSNQKNHDGDDDDAEKLVQSVRKKRVKKVKKKKKKSTMINQSNEQNQTTSKELILDHIQTKQLIEKRREELRDGWLISNPLSYLPMNVPPNTPITTSEPQGSSEEPPLSEAPPTEHALVINSSEFHMKDISAVVEATADKLEKIALAHESMKQSEESDDIEVLPPAAEANPISYPDKKDANVNHSSRYGYFNSTISSDSDLSDDCEGDPESGFFLVENKLRGELQSLLIKIKKNLIKEVDSLYGRTVEILDLRSLKSVHIEKVDGEEKQVCLEFNTVKASKRRRQYVCEDVNSAQAIFKKLKPFVDAKVLENTVLGALQCLKCGSQFSKDCAAVQLVKTKNPYAGIEAFICSSKDFEKETSACPNCRSTVVIQVEKMPVPSVPDINNDKDRRLQATSSPKQGLKSSNIASHFPIGDKSMSIVNRSPFSTKKKLIRTSNDGLYAAYTESDINVEGKESSLPSQLKTRRNSSQSNHSSSIAVISDTESNLDVIPEKVSSASPVPSSSAEISSQSPSRLQSLHDAHTSSCTVLTSVAKSPNSSHCSNVLETGRAISSSVTESLVHAQVDECNASVEGKVTESSFQSSENIDFINLFQGKEQFSCETFTSIDHRLKLHLEVVMFDDDETFLSCLQTGIVLLPSGEEFKGLFVISSKRMFILKLLSDICEDMKKNLKHILVCPLKHLTGVRVFLGNQGFSLVCGSDNKVFVFLVRDADLCNCFISHLSDILNDRFKETNMPFLVSEAEESLSQIKSEVFGTYTEMNYADEVLLHLFGYWSNKDENSLQSVCFIVTQSRIFIAGISFKKQATSADKDIPFHYVPITVQALSDLIEVKLKPNLFGAEMVFKDEDKDIVSHWRISTETKTSLFSFISAFKSPWESIFRVELPLGFTQ